MYIDVYIMTGEVKRTKHHLAKVYVYRGGILLRCGHRAVCSRGIYLNFKSFLECRNGARAQNVCTHTHTNECVGVCVVNNVELLLLLGRFCKCCVCWNVACVVGAKR